VHLRGNQSENENEKHESRKVGRKELWKDAVTIPNALTVLRIVATPGICYLVVMDRLELALASFWVAGFCDWLDGYLARMWKQTSVFGSWLDPLADKLLVGSTMITLTVKGIIPLPLGMLIIGRDAVLVLGSFYIRSITKPKDVGFFEISTTSGVQAVDASWISKWNTLFQFGLIWFSMTNVAFGLPSDGLMPAVWAISGTSTILSGYDYWKRANWNNIFGEK